MRRVALVFMVVAGYFGSACGGTVPATTTETRQSGQSGLMGETFAGQNKCNPKSHERPFAIEWDATDMSSFEAFASNDVVVVRYEGCELSVLDRCRDDDVRGRLGAYRPIDWTSGQLETVDIASESELYAKLPLGVASLGGRVQAGEAFHMEYYVAGTRSASQAAVYRADLEELSGCAGATHFVYAYNLGAFALGSVARTEAKADASLYGFGAGGNRKTSHKVDKKGGNLAVCRADSATEVQGCKTPIRLVLRSIKDGENPDRAGKVAPETDAALNAAGKVSQKVEMSEEAQARFAAAQEKFNSGDGKGCLAEIDAHDLLDPKHKSTDPKSGLGLVRAQCLMQAGQCDAGKALARKALEASLGTHAAPDQVDKGADGLAARYCQGANMAPRDQFLKAITELNQGAYGKKDSAFCQRAYDTFKRFQKTVKPRDENDDQVEFAQRNVVVDGPRCFAKAGDCPGAFKVFQVEFPVPEGLSAADKKKHLQTVFESAVSECKPKK